MIMASTEGAIASTSASSATASQDRGASSVFTKLGCKLSSLQMNHEKKKMQRPPSLSCILNAPLVNSTCSASDDFNQVFNYFDENGDGKISPTELCDRMRIMGEELSLEQAEAVVQSVDSDGDGLLGFDDFLTLVDVQGEEGDGERERSINEAFKVYELKGEGCITAKSLRKVLGLLGEHRSIEECKVMIRKFDENGDGVISYDEFRNMML